ncbi:MAG TPA: hypothetical protein VJ843_00410 [Candidatus Saccharimonadales bacterium]|nr:hypothetical protein [Candidatus Saccharimonadales bacterium]
MTSHKRLLRIKALLLIIIGLSMVQMTWGQKPASSVKTEPQLITREQLRGLGRALANCLDDSKPCKGTFGANEIAYWLTDSKWRAASRVGLDALDFSDFEALHKKYGNALAKLHSYTLDNLPFQEWVWNISFDDGDGVIIVVDGCVRNPLDGRYSHKGDPPYYTRSRPDDCIEVIPINEYATMLARLMAQNVKSPITKDQFADLLAEDKNDQVTVDQFVNFMISKQ